MKRFTFYSTAALVLIGLFGIPHEASAFWGITDAVGDVVMWLLVGILSLFGWFLGVMGWLLNLAVTQLVIGMGGMVRTQGFGSSIDQLWSVFRDIVNLTFVFSLIYIGIMTIVHGSMGGLKKGLASVIVAALLVNFSLFFTKAIIDVSNIVADSVYKKMVSDAASRAEGRGISDAFMARMGIMSIQAGGDSAGQRAALSQFMQPNGGGIAYAVVYTVGGSILMFLLAIAFGLGAFLLITRFAMLIILMITSPIAFLPSEVPMLGKYKKQWWSTLTSQAFLAPIYLFGLYISLLILQGTPYGQSGNLRGLFLPGDKSAALATLMFYIVAMVLIVGTTKMAKQMSTAGASQTTKMMGWAGKAVGASLGATGYMGRMTIGRAANSEAVQKRLAGLKSVQANKNSWAITRGLARVGAGGITSVQKSSFDARANGLVGKFTKGMDLDVGKASKENYESWLKGKKQDEADYARSLNVKDTPEIEAEKAALKKDTDALHAAEEKLKEANREKNKEAAEKAKMEMEYYKESSSDKRAEIAKKETANQASYAQIVKDRNWLSRLVAGHDKKEGGAIEKAIKEDIEKQKKSAKKGEEYKPPEKKAKEKGGGGGESKPKDEHKPDAGGGHGDDHGGGGHGGGGGDHH